ncbi:uncharacterized protein LOC114273999 isoform X3 [Camellia sinensis]|uniref:uncharacterized protein LOC114273999 isoform X3 n=1 Tax=Camellia sinensis TaxID=4442 RepID=UPI0010362414|nr:uncharacterized protein LOC114273999 isoform X3 [Camellia sinensis]
MAFQFQSSNRFRSECYLCGNYASFQMPVHGSMVPVQVEGSDEQYQQEYAKAPLFAVGTSIGANILEYCVKITIIIQCML